MKFSTRAIHLGEKPNCEPGGSGDVISPLHLTTTFARKKIDEPTKGYEYTRSLNPTRKTLETKLSSLEQARFALAFASGLAAETSVFLALLKPGDHVIASDDLYGGSRRLFEQVFQKNFNLQFTFVDACNTTAVENAKQPNTKLIWLETPTNPLLKLCDIQQIAHFAKQNKFITVVDNTFMSPVFQQPLALGADLVLHSTTKFINGHSDSLGGCVMLNDPSLFEKIQFIQNSAGNVLSPFDAYLVCRGIKTLDLRMQQHQNNALKIATYLEQHPKIENVRYPGLKSHPQYSLAQTQMSGFGGIISVELKTTLKSSISFVENLNLFLLAESLGGVESLIELPAIMTHASVPAAERKKIGLSDTLIRLSVGIEDPSDLIADLERELSKL